MLPCPVCFNILQADFSCKVCKTVSPPKPQRDLMRDLLREIDQAEDIDVNEWEADFLESVLSHSRPLTEKQVESAQQMVDKYL